MTGHTIKRIERLNYVLGGVTIIVAALTQTSRPALGVAVGVVLTCLNFAALRVLVSRWTAAVAAGDSRGSNRIYLILPKMIAMMGAVALSALFLPINVIGFLIGYSVFLPSIVIGAMLDVMAPGPAPAAGPPTGGDATPPQTPASESHG